VALVVESEFRNNDEDGLDPDDLGEITLIGVISIGTGFDDHPALKFKAGCLLRGP
jgi:hypothetical protein